MVASQQAGNGELRSPEGVDTAAQPSALVPADPDPRRGRVGRWWKRVLGAGTQGAAGRVFPGRDRLRKLEERQQARARERSVKLEESEARSLDLPEVTHLVIGEIEKRLARPGPHPAPFMRFTRGASQLEWI